MISYECLDVEAIKTKDEETKRELEIETRKLQAEMNRVQGDTQKLVSEYAKEKEQMYRHIQELEKMSRQENQRFREEHNYQATSLRPELRLQRTPSNFERRLTAFQKRAKKGYGAMVEMVMDALSCIVNP